MKDNPEQRICPRCGQEYTQRPATSHIDGSMICPECGTREALDSLGVDAVEQEKIINIIHSKEGYNEEQR